MNNLIRKLADQAIAHANQTWNPDSEPERFVLIAMQKHAELIVRECAEILDKKILPPSHPMNSIGYRLKEYFGVEE